MLDARLKYRDVADAVEKMHAVLSSPTLAEQLFEALPAAVALHSVDSHRQAFIERLHDAGVPVAD